MICIITGPTAGIGRQSAFDLAEHGFKLALVCRNRSKGEALMSELHARFGSQAADLFIADFSSLATVRQAASDIRQRYDHIDVLLNNAGMINLKRYESVDGFEMTFAVNHLAPFYFTNLLLDKVIGGTGRIVTVASTAHKYGNINWHDLDYRITPYKMFPVYGQSKLANILFTRELARRVAGRKLTANCLHPGVVRSDIGANEGRLLQKVLMTLSYPFTKSLKEGADTSVYLCTSKDVKEATGEYFVDRKPRRTSEAAMDAEAGKRLWQVSEEMLANRGFLIERQQDGIQLKSQQSSSDDHRRVERDR